MIKTLNYITELCAVKCLMIAFVYMWHPR